MIDTAHVFCRHCGGSLYVYQPTEDRFCSFDCAVAYGEPRSGVPVLVYVVSILLAGIVAVLIGLGVTR